MAAPRRPKFDEARKALFLEHLATKGLFRAQAAHAVGVTPQTAYDHISANPDFRAAVELAEMTAAEPVERALYKAALDGDVRAQTFILTNVHRRSGRYVTAQKQFVEVSGTVDHVLDTRPMIERILELQTVLEQRRALEEGHARVVSIEPVTIDVEAVDVEAVDVEAVEQVVQAPHAPEIFVSQAHKLATPPQPAPRRPRPQKHPNKRTPKDVAQDG